MPRLPHSWLLLPACALLSACTIGFGEDDEDDGFAQGKAEVLVDEEYSNDYAVDAAGEQIARAGIAAGGVRPLSIRDLDDTDGDFELLTSDSVLASHPRFTPDGSRIVFEDHDSIDFEAHSRLAVVGTDGSGYRRLDLSTAANEEVGDIVFVDETSVIYERSSSALDYRYWTIALDGDSPPELAAVVPRDRPVSATLDPSGAQILWEYFDIDVSPGVTRVFVGPVDSAEGVSIAEHGYSATWSPDGTRIAYIADTGETEDDGLPLSAVYLVAADGSGEPARVPGLDCCLEGPLTWLPDDRIVVSNASYVVGDHRLYTLDASGLG
jgi:hypothetical protein